MLKIDIMAGTFTTLLVTTYKWTDERLYYTPTELHGAIKYVLSVCPELAPAAL